MSSDQEKFLSVREHLIKAYWEEILNYLKKDLAYIWTDDVKKYFAGLESEVKKIAFVMRKLNSHYRKNKISYETEIDYIKHFIQNINRIEAKKEWVKHIHDDLVKIISGAEILVRSDRLLKLEERIWNNLLSSGLLGRILEKSLHAHVLNKEDFVGVNFWTEIGGDGMYLQIFIRNKTDSSAMTTPKLFRLATNEKEQRKLCRTIWAGITIDDILFIAKLRAQDYYERDKKLGLSTSQSQGIKKLYPLIQSGKVDIQLIPEYAQYKIAAKNKGISRKKRK